MAVLSSQFHMGSGCWLSPIDVLCLTPPGDQGGCELSEVRPTFGVECGWTSTQISAKLTARLFQSRAKALKGAVDIIPSCQNKVRPRMLQRGLDQQYHITRNYLVAPCILAITYTRTNITTRMHDRQVYNCERMG